MTSQPLPAAAPQPLFCLTCGPGTLLVADPAAPLLRCPSCGAVTERATRPMFVVTGASGAGKTTVTAPLRRLLPECEVFEGDLINRIALLGWDVWRDTWLRIGYAVALNGRSTVLCTSLLPEHLEQLPARGLLGDIRFCNLDCPDDMLAVRLRARPAWRNSGSAEAVLEHQRFAAWLRANIRPTFDTSAITAEQAAGLIAGWIRPQLD